jgi:hypothetical protein
MSTNDGDNSAAAAAAAADAKELASMKKMLLDTKVDGGKSMWTATLETFGMADGKTHKGDVILTYVGNINEDGTAETQSQQAL